MATLYPYDANALLHDGSAVTADGAGSESPFNVGAAARFPAVAVVNVTALDETTTDETYRVTIRGSAASGMTSPQELGSMLIAATGRYTILFDNDQAGTVYQYIDVYFDVGGTTPSIEADVFMAPLFPVA